MFRDSRKRTIWLRVAGASLRTASGKAEPAWIRMLGGFGQNENVVEIAQRGVKFGEVRAPGGDEAGQLLELRDSDCRLHVGRFEVVTDVAVNIFVVVSAGQVAQFPFKAATAGVGFSGIAPAVAAPVAKRFGQLLERGRLREHASAFAHGDVVRGIEAGGGEVAEGANGAPVVERADGVATILDHPEVVFGWQSAMTASRSNGLPSVCASMIAFVRSETAASS